MDLLSIRDATASRPSLISSIWSLQVQAQQEPTADDIQMGSQQSLPQLPEENPVQIMPEAGPSLRSSKSLSELSLYFRENGKGLRMQEAPSFVWKSQQAQNADPDQRLVSKQQKERNICDWLQSLQCSDSSSPSVMSASASPGMIREEPR